MTGVHLVDRSARDRADQLKLAAGRHDAVPGRDHNRGRDIDLTNPAGRGELAGSLDGRHGGSERGPAQLLLVAWIVTIWDKRGVAA